MGMGSRDEFPVVDTGMIPTQFVSGVLPPRLEDGVWIIDVYECRGAERIVVARFAMTQEAYQRSVATALTPVASALGVALRARLDS
jgi:hypothetical protein